MARSKDLITRKCFLETSLLAPAVALLPPSRTSNTPLILENANHRLGFDPKTASLFSFAASHAPEQEFIPKSANLPVFVIQYLDSTHVFRQILSSQATHITVRASPNPSILHATFKGLAGHDLDVAVSVRIPDGEPASYWGIQVHNHANLQIIDVQFPFLVVSYSLIGKDSEAKSEWLLTPFWTGKLQKAPEPQDLEPDSPHAWQFRPENQATWHYPGLTMAQFLAYGNNRAGILVRCLDTGGAIKQIKAVHHSPGVRLGISHAGDWPTNGSRQLEYEIAIESFSGDWYRAAEIYRTWSLQQHWARTPLRLRKDVPGWLLEAPPHIMIRLQGELDTGPVFPNAAFLPYTKLIPLLDRIAEAVDSPLVPILMAWERGGPWVYPDCFPPIGGDAALKRFASLARERHWHVGSYSNGTRWVTAQLWSGYDGADYFRQQQGAKSVCRTVEGDLWRELWDIAWRPSYTGCLGSQQTHAIAVDYVNHLVANGFDWIQFLDQNVGCSTFPCYSPNHGHAPQPGKWMTVAMTRLLDSFQQIADRAHTESSGNRTLAFSVESTPNEFFMPRFPVCDVRVSPPGHTGILAGYVPLYHFLHHEFLLLQGGFGFGPEPFHQPIQTAYNFVLGEICGGVLTGDGTLLGKDSINWAPWEPPIGSDNDALEMLRHATALRRAEARRHLVFGRMMRPVSRFECQTIRWTYEGRSSAIPAAFHAAWQDQDGGFALAVANWTKDEQRILIEDERFAASNRIVIHAAKPSSGLWVPGSALAMPPLSCAIIQARSA